MADRSIRSGAHSPRDVWSQKSSQSVGLERYLDRLSPGLFALYLHTQELQIREVNLMINMAKAGAFISGAFPAGRPFRK